MAYTPYYPSGWQSGEEGGTPITPDALNNMEDGIAAANAIGDPVMVAHGGTGATRGTAARINLETYLTLTSGTNAVLYNALDVLTVGETICAYLTIDAVKVLLADNSINFQLSGTINRYTTKIFTFSMCSPGGRYLYQWQAEYANGAWTRNSGFVFEGTAL